MIAKDTEANLVSMNPNGVEYYYIRNAQGDIIGLFDGTGIQVVSYTYDSWGKLISIKDKNGTDITNDINHVGYKNPYRYRGYRYDTETGLYYLQSRYYNPEWGKFINADDVEVTEILKGELLGANLFTYCMNDPINETDSTGFFIETIFDIISIGVSISKVMANPTMAANWVALGADMLSAALPGVTGGGTAVRAGFKAINGNSKASRRLQHGYEIFEKATGKVAKTGVSGGILNKNGTSRRANAQVNKLNERAGYNKYSSRVVVKNIKGRDRILKWGKLNANRLRKLEHPMGEHQRP